VSDFEIHKYDDIINLPHHVSKSHKPMSMTDRAAQFGAFAALNGHSDAISETGRLTSPEYNHTDYTMQMLDAKLQIIKENIETSPCIKVTYFKPDELKSGGEYVEYEGRIRRIDEVAKLMIFCDETEIQIDTVYEIKSELTDAYDDLNYL